MASLGAIDPGSVQMRVSGLGKCRPASIRKTQTVAYQVTQKTEG